MRIINIISDRKNITLNSDVILYIIMNGKNCGDSYCRRESIPDAYCFERSGRTIEGRFCKST